MWPPETAVAWQRLKTGKGVLFWLHLEVEATNLLPMSQHILFVDDEIPIREMLSLYFKRKGFAVTAAGNGAEAVRLAETTPMDAIILDINLGGENGLELLTVFKKQYPNVPVIMFTSLDHDPELLKAALAGGADAFMSKADPLDVLAREVQRLLA